MRSALLRLVATSALVLAAAPAPAQTPAYAATPVLDSATETAVMRDIAAARSRGIPAEPLLAKVREGRLKRATGQRIRTAVSALVARLDSARVALGPDALPTELVAGADVLAAGGSVSAVRAIRQATTMRPVSAPLGALAQLVASGVPVSRAVEIVLELLHRNAPPAYVVAFGNAVEADAVSGLPPEKAALFRLRAIEAGGFAEAAVTAGALAGPPGSGTTSVLTAPNPPANPAPRRRP